MYIENKYGTNLVVSIQLETPPLPRLTGTAASLKGRLATLNGTGSYPAAGLAAELMEPDTHIHAAVVMDGQTGPRFAVFPQVRLQRKHFSSSLVLKTEHKRHTNRLNRWKRKTTPRLSLHPSFIFCSPSTHLSSSLLLLA